MKYALRLLWRQPRHTLLVVAVMALGIAATTTLWSVAYGVLMRPLPWPNAGRVIVLKETRGGRLPRFGALTNAAVLAWQDDAKTVDEIGVWSQGASTLSGEGDPERIQTVSASPGLFRALGVTPLAGSLFDASQVETPVVVLSERLWRRRFNANRDIINATIRLDNQPYTVLGILSDAQAYPDRRTEAWLPMRVAPATNNSLSLFSGVARLRPGVSPAQAAAEGTARGRFAPDTGMTTTAIFGGNGPIEITATPMQDALTSDVRQPLVILLAAVGLLLVTATANVAGLQVARAAARRREMAIRAAIGAAGRQLVAQLLLENLMLGAIGGVTGVVLAWWIHSVLPTLLPGDFPRIDDVRLDLPIVAAAVGVTVLTSVICGWLPALRARAEDPVNALKEDGAAPVGMRHRSSPARTRMVIMVGQVAVTSVLLVGASLLGRSFWSLLSVDRGYEPAGVYSTRLSLPGSNFSPERRYTIVSQVLDRLKGLPELGESGFTSELPLTPGGSTAAFTLRAPASGETVSVQASPRLVSPHLVAAMGMRVIAGRGFEDTDVESSEPVALVNRAFAHKYLNDAALDVKVPMGVGYQNPGTDARIVGIVENIRYVMAGEPSQPEIYYCYQQLPHRLPIATLTLLVRTRASAEALTAAVRSAIHEADPGIAPSGVLTLEERIVSGLARPRLYAIVLGAFALFALVVSTVGLFGVLSFNVAQRSRELAIRTALGASAGNLVRLVVTQAMTITGIGLVIGLIGSFALTPFTTSLLFGVATHDLATYAIVPVLLVGVAVLASIAPARRAASAGMRS